MRSIIIDEIISEEFSFLTKFKYQNIKVVYTLIRNHFKLAVRNYTENRLELLHSRDDSNI